MPQWTRITSATQVFSHTGEFFGHWFNRSFENKAFAYTFAGWSLFNMYLFGVSVPSGVDPATSKYAQMYWSKERLQNHPAAKTASE